MTGALITLLSSTIANGLPTFSRVASPKRLGPGCVELEADDRLVLLEGRLRIGQRVAADHDALLDDIGRRAAAVAAPSCGRQDLVARRQAAAPRFIDGHAGVDELEGQLGGAPRAAP